MPVYNNRYYPSEQAVTWADLEPDDGLYVVADYVVADYIATEPGGGFTWANGTANWNSWTDSNVSWNFVTTTNIDLGSVRSGYPISTAEFDSGTNNTKTCLISYQTSTDGITYTNVSAGVLTGRYVRTQVTSNGSYLSRLETTIKFDTEQEVFTGVNTAALTGTVNGRILNLSSVGNIAHISTQNSVGTYSASSYDIDVISANTNAITFVVKDLDTWGKANVDVNTLDILVQGFPKIAANARLGIVDRIY